MTVISNLHRAGPALAARRRGRRHHLAVNARADQFPNVLMPERALSDTVKGARILVLLDGKTAIDVEDTHIAGPVAMGVWTKADSVIAFDDFGSGTSIKPGWSAIEECIPAAHRLTISQISFSHAEHAGKPNKKMILNLTCSELYRLTTALGGSCFSAPPSFSGKSSKGSTLRRTARSCIPCSVRANLL
jgi:hypothetical protein